MDLKKCRSIFFLLLMLFNVIHTSVTRTQRFQKNIWFKHVIRKLKTKWSYVIWSHLTVTGDCNFGSLGFGLKDHLYLLATRLQSSISRIPYDRLPQWRAQHRLTMIGEELCNLPSPDSVRASRPAISLIWLVNTWRACHQLNLIGWELQGCHFLLSDW